MKSEALHSIQKEVIQVTLPDARAALTWQADGYRSFIDMLSAQIERCFQDYEGDDHLIIEKLELDLGRFSLSALNAELPDRFYAAFRTALEKCRQAGSMATSPREMDYSEFQDGTKYSVFRDHKAGRPGDPALDGLSAQPRDDEGQYKVYGERRARLESFFFFLQKGYLPWWASRLEPWNESWLKALTAEEMTGMKFFLAAHDTTSIARLCTQFDDNFIAALLSILGTTANTIGPWQWMKTLLEGLQERLRAGTAKPAADVSTIAPSHHTVVLPPLKLPLIRQRYWSLWVAYALGKSQLPSLAALLYDRHDVFAFVAAGVRDDAWFKQFTLAAGEMPLLWRGEGVQAQASAFPAPLPDRGAEKEIDRQPGLPDVPRSFSGGTPPGEAKVSEARGDRQRTQVSGDPAETLLVYDAGLVLLHPLLVPLFRDRHWLDDKHFFDSYTQTMAVYALHYMATGNTVVPEYQLILPKLLVGMPCEAVLDPVEPLTDLDTAACEELLTAVIGHWKVLRTTSPAGLREAYLQRSGKLECREGKWNLTVQHKAQDILLSHLPWPVSIIKLPWMNEMLTVTWL